MISFALDDEQQLVRETVHRYAKDVLRPKARRHEAEGLSEEAAAELWELGLVQADLEEGLPQLTAALVHEELAWGDPGAAVALWWPGLALPALRELGSKEQQERLLGPLRRGPGRRGALGYAERWKRRVSGFTTTAQPTAAGYLLSGTKSFVIGAREAELTVVFAQLNPDVGWDGIAAFAVTGRPRDDAEASFRLGDPHELLGLRAAPAGELCFEEHLVPEEDRLRGDGGDLCAAALRLFGRAQLLGAARQVGLARAAYELALEYTQERRAFGKPVAHFQAVAFSLADMATDVDAARWLLWRAAAAADQAQGAVDLALCAEAAIHASEVAFRAADTCVQLLGGAGYMEDFPAEKWLREAKALGLLYGTAEVSEQILAAEALGHPAEVEAPLSAVGAAAGAGAGRAPRHGLPSGSLQPFFT